MTFEEFFKKKKINLALLKAAEPELFAEFELHFEQMGEKSFDHTKKYWFNTLRHKYHAPDEPKVEKVKIENPLAEQTIIEAITEPVAAPAPKLGFKPKFKTAVTVGDTTVPPEQKEPEINIEETATAPKLGFKPKFKSAVANPVQAENSGPVEPQVNATSGEGASAPKLGFKPKFRSAVTQSNSPESSGIATPEKDIAQAKEKPENENTEQPADEPDSKPVYKPKFKMQNFKPKE